MDIKMELLEKLRPELLEIVVKLLKDIKRSNDAQKTICGYHQNITIAKILVDAYDQEQKCETASIEFVRRD